MESLIRLAQCRELWAWVAGHKGFGGKERQAPGEKSGTYEQSPPQSRAIMVPTAGLTSEDCRPAVGTHRHRPRKQQAAEEGEAEVVVLSASPHVLMMASRLMTEDRTSLQIFVTHLPHVCAMLGARYAKINKGWFLLLQSVCPLHLARNRSQISIHCYLPIQLYGASFLCPPWYVFKSLFNEYL